MFTIILALILYRDGVWIQRDTAEPWVTKGYQVKTQAEYDEAMCVQAGGSISNGVCVIPPPPAPVIVPAQFENGIATPDQAGHWMLMQPGDNDLDPVVSLRISDSPIDPATWQARKTAALATNTVIVNTYRQDLRDVKSALATNKVEMQAIDPTAFTAAQRTQITALRRELLDLLNEVDNLRRALARKERQE